MIQCFRSVLLVAVLMSASLAGASDIWTPRPHNPAFVQPNGTFVAEVHASSSLATTGWSATVQNDLRTWTCTVTAAATGKIYHGTEDGWKLTIRVPSDTPPELLNLTIRHTTGENLTSVRAVSVVKNFEESFYVLQCTDQHIDNQTAVMANGSSSTKWATGSVDSMLWAAPVINLINPRFVMYTGDNIHLYFSATSWCGMDDAVKRTQLYLKGLNALSVPTAVTNGNHDIGYSSYIYSREWRDTYEREMGQRNFSFRMGSFYALAQEFSYDEYLPWARSDYAAAYADSSIKYRLVAQHFTDNWTNPCTSSTPCNMMIVGHNHSTQRLQTSPFPAVSTASAQDHQKAAYFNFEKTSSGWNCPQTTTHAEGVNVHTLVGDWGTPRVRNTFSAVNDGTQSSNTATIINGLPLDFYSGRVKFLMAQGTYTVSGGTIEARYDYASGSKTAVLVKVNITKSSTVKVTITKNSTPTPTVPTAPGNLKAQAASTSQINLTWTDNSGNESGFKIERKTGSGGTWAQIATTGAGATSYSNTGLASNTVYVYRIRAYNSVGDSGYSNETSATTGNKPPVVTLTAPANGATFTSPVSITLNATASDSDGIIAKVEFFSGATKLGEDTSSPYGFSWTNVAVGSYSLVAKATDNNGATATSGAASVTVTSAAVVGNGNGLLGTYYDDMFYAAPKICRNDATVDFSWGSGSPDASIGADTFCAFWVGQVQAQYSETYTFTTVSDDGVRLRVNGQVLIDNWTDHGETENSGSITLVAGQKYNICLDYYENTGGATVKLLWSSPSTPKQIVPKSQLYSDTLRTPENPAITTNGLDYRYYQGDWNALPDFAALTPLKTGTVSDFNLSVRTQNDYFGIQFTGFVDAPVDGTYAFYTTSDDGSRLYIGSRLVVDNDGMHGPVEQAGWIALKAGKHALTVTFFEKNNAESLSVSWSGPGFGKQLVPVGRLYRVPPAIGDGLLATYYDTEGLSGSSATRVDATVSFDWGTSAPVSGFGADTYSVRWTGYVVPPVGGSYAFTARTDDGVRLWVNGQLIIDYWQLRSVAGSSGAITLTGGQKYAIKMEYYNSPGYGVAQLYWSGPGISRQVVPQKYLYSK